MQLANVFVGVEVRELPLLKKVLSPKRIPLLDFSRRRDVQFPRQPNALLIAKRAEKVRRVLILPLKFAT
ncbi:hypothetical protein [Variovorax fucosicus]|uniref:hypothetical protein n=1 Tax=Variovorax fucosicus TaxID=3053517 RepID=UPI002575C23B|nr:hypothetical protein [Variovorax sp. J22G47]MDM0058998.1 hypothetical protein [Variovorax sp. J22G47]